MTQIHVLNLGQVLELVAVGIVNAVNCPECIGVRQPTAPGFVGLDNAPDHLGTRVIIPDACQHFVAQAAGIQLKIGAAGENIQRFPDLALTAVADGDVHILDFGIGGGNSFAVEGKAVMKDHVGAALLQLFYVCNGQIAATAGLHQFHPNHVGVCLQLGDGVIQLTGSDCGQIHSADISIEFAALGGHGVLDADSRHHSFQTADLIGGQAGGGEAEVFQRGQILNILLQCVKIVAAMGQGQVSGGVFYCGGAAAQAHRISHLDGGVLGHVLGDGLIAGAAGEVSFLQVGVFLQLGDGFCGDYLFDGLHSGISGGGGSGAVVAVVAVGDVLVHLIIVENLPDTLVAIGEVGSHQGALGVTPAHAIGIGVAVIQRGVGDGAVGHLCLDFLPLCLSHLDLVAGVDEAQQLQIQTHQSFHILDAGVTDVQVLQAVTGSQGGYVSDVTAPGDLQELQLLAVAQGSQILDGAAGENGDLQIGHISAEADIYHVGVVTQVDILGIGTILQEITVAVLNAVNGTNHFSIRQPAAVLVVLEHTPDDLDMGIVVPDAGHGFVAQTAVVQQEVLAVDQLVQGIADLGLALVANVNLDKFHTLVAGGQGFAKEFELVDVVKDHIGQGILQTLNVIGGQVALSFGGHQLHPVEVGQHGQALDIDVYLLRSHGTQIQRDGFGAHFHAVEADGAGNFLVGISQLQGIQLHNVQSGGLQGQILQVGQILQIFQQLVEFISAVVQGNGSFAQGDGAAAHADGVDDFDVGMCLGIGSHGGVAGAAGEVNLLQIGIVIQLRNGIFVHHHSQFRHLFGVLGLGGFIFGCSAAAHQGQQHGADQQGGNKPVFLHKFLLQGIDNILLYNELL